MPTHICVNTHNRPFYHAFLITFIHKNIQGHTVSLYIQLALMEYVSHVDNVGERFFQMYHFMILLFEQIEN